MAAYALTSQSCMPVLKYTIMQKHVNLSTLHHSFMSRHVLQGASKVCSQKGGKPWRWESAVIIIHERREHIPGLVRTKTALCLLSRNGVCCGWEMQKAGMSFLIFPHTSSSAQKKSLLEKLRQTQIVKSSPQGTKGEGLSFTKSPKSYSRY